MGKVYLTYINLYKSSYRSFSKAFDTEGKTLIGQKLSLHILGDFFFKVGVISADPSSTGQHKCVRYC